MRILVAAQSLAPVGGVEMSTLQVSRELARRGHEVHVQYVEGGALERQWRAFARSMVRVPSFRFSRATPVRDFRALRPSLRAAAELQPDVLYLNRPEHAFWGLFASFRARRPLVVHLRHSPDYPGVSVVGRFGSRFLAVSEYMRAEWVRAGLPADRTVTVHNGIDLADYPAGGPAERSAARAALGLPDGPFLALCYGRIASSKGQHLLLDAWQRWAPRSDRAALVILGDAGGSARDRDYYSALRDRDLPGVHWMPARRDVMTALHAADVIVLPAQWQEPFGRVVIEGLATGRPVVATRVGGIPEILDGGFPEWVVEPDDVVDGLASVLADLADWRSRDPDLATRTRAHVARHFSLGGTVDAVETSLLAAAGSTTGALRAARR